MKTDIVPDQFNIYKEAMKVRLELALIELSDSGSDTEDEFANMAPPVNLRLVQPFSGVVDAIIESIAERHAEENDGAELKESDYDEDPEEDAEDTLDETEDEDTENESVQ